MNSLTGQPISTQGGKDLVNCIYNCCPNALDTATESEDSIQSCDTLPLPNFANLFNV